MDQPGKVANPARGQLNRENNIPLSMFAPENLVSRDSFGSPVPRQPAHLHTQAESGAYVRNSSRVPRRRIHTFDILLFSNVNWYRLKLFVFVILYLLFGVRSFICLELEKPGNSDDTYYRILILLWYCTAVSLLYCTLINYVQNL